VWYLLFPPGAPTRYFVPLSGGDDRYATLDVDNGLVIKIIVLFSCLGAAVSIGLATVRSRVLQRRRRLFDAGSIAGLATLAGASVMTVAYQVGHRFTSSQSPGHWPSAHYDNLVPLMPVIGLLVGILGAALWLKTHPRDGKSDA
jgi:hypothetical protein